MLVVDHASITYFCCYWVKEISGQDGIIDKKFMVMRNGGFRRENTHLRNRAIDGRYCNKKPSNGFPNVENKENF